MSLSPNFKLPFGKYRGMEIDKIRLCDPQYIVWLHDKTTLTSPLKEEVDAIYDDCIEAANRDQTQPQKRRSASMIYQGARV